MQKFRSGFLLRYKISIFGRIIQMSLKVLWILFPNCLFIVSLKWMQTYISLLQTKQLGKGRTRRFHKVRLRVLQSTNLKVHPSFTGFLQSMLRTNYSKISCSRRNLLDDLAHHLQLKSRLESSRAKSIQNCFD